MTPSELLISQGEIDKLSEALANDGNPDPIATAIAEQSAKVGDFTNRFLVAEARLTRLTRSLVLHQLYTLIGDVSDARRADYENAMRELEGIRDGKFPDLALAESTPQPLPPGGGRFGGKVKLAMPND